MKGLTTEDTEGTEETAELEVMTDKHGAVIAAGQYFKNYEICISDAEIFLHGINQEGGK